jgi:uncharacterized protein YjbI with pentapeptide repeats
VVLEQQLQMHYLGNASNQATDTVSGDVTMTNAGVASIGTDKVVTSMLGTNAVTTAKITDANVTTAKLADAAVTTVKITDANVTTAKLADANVTNAKLDKANIPLSGFGAATANVALGSKKLTGVGNPTAAQDAATKAYVDSTVSTTNTNVTALSTLADGKIYLGNASNQATEVTVSGDVTMTNAGVVSIGTDKVVTSMLATNAVTTVKITDANVTTAKLADANVTNAKLDKANIPLSGFGAATANVALGAKKLTGVGNPTAAQDAATKAYVDSTVSTTNTNVTALSTLADGKIYLGNASNQATEVTVSGDVTMTNAGVVSIGTDKVVTSMLATNAVTTAKITDANITTAKLADAAVTTVKITDANVTTAKLADANVTNAKLDKANIPLSGFGAATANVALGAKKLTGVGNPTAAQDAATKAYVDSTVSTTNTNVTALSTLDNGKIYLGNASNQATEVTVSGDVTMTNAGVASIGTDKVVTSMLATNAVTTAKITDANITTAKLADAAVTTVKITDANVTTAKLADANVTNAKLDKANIPLSGFGAATANVALGAKKLTGVGNPTAAQDAATKAYVDSTVSTTNTNVTALSTLDNGKIYLGNASNQATEVTVSGDVTMTNAGVASIGTDKVVTSMLATEAVTSGKIKDGEIVNADISLTAAIADSKLATIATTGKVSNSATTATKDNTPSTIVARDASGNFTAGTITANLTGNVTGNISGTAANVTGTVAVGNGGTGATSLTGMVKGTGTTAMTAATAGTDYSAGTSALASGIVKSTTSTGALSIAVAGTDYIAPYTSQTANFILASPSGSAGTPSFRALTATDVPTLNQSTTGNAATATATGITDDATTSTTVYPTFVAGTSGNLPQKVTSTRLSFVPSTGALTATSFVGSGSGLTGTAASLSIGGNAATVTTNANLSGIVTSSGNTTAIAAGAITNTMLANSAVANLSGTNTGDNAVNSLYSGLVSNATHTGDVAGATTLTLATVNTNVGSFGTSTSVPTFTVNGKGLVTAASATAIPTATTTTAGLLTSTDWNTFNNKQGAITLSTTGNSGASSFTSNTLNIPTYTLSGLGGQPLATNLTSIGGLTNASGVLINNGSGIFSYSNTPTLTGTNFTGVPYTALSGTVPTWNQNTTGTSANVTGTVAIANGGTGSSTQNFVDLTTAQTVAGNKTFSNTITANTIVKTGGTSAQFLMADGSVSSGTPLLTEADIEITATAGQTSFALTQTPSSLSKVKMYINGIRISKTAYTISGSTLTYIPANNESYSISVGDRVQFEFAY